MAVTLNGLRYRVEAFPDWSVGRMKQALWEGGIHRSDKASEIGEGMSSWEDLVLVYKGQVMNNNLKQLAHYNVPPVSTGCAEMHRCI